MKINSTGGTHMSQIGKQAYEAIKVVVDGLTEDINKFYDKEVNAAGGRLRKGLKQVADILRAEKKNILEVRNSRLKK
jgi:hypothetical protein